MFEFIQKGGYVMWPITGLGILSMAIIIERSIYFMLTSWDYEKFRDSILSRIGLYGIDGFLPMEDRGTKVHRTGFFSRFKYAIADFRSRSNPYARITGIYSSLMNSPSVSRDEALRRTGSEEIEKMERHFKTLSAISHISPLLGLLGTVTGIIAAFSVIAGMGGQVDVTALAGGIWEAMITTAAGLIVAIPSQLAFIYFEKRVAWRVNRMSYLISHLNEELYRITAPSSDVYPPSPSSIISYNGHEEDIL